MSDFGGASTSSGNIHLNFIQRNGGAVLLHAGHEYITKRKHKSGLIVWECVARKKNKCKGVIKIKDNNIIESKSHHCQPNFAKIDLALKMQICKDKITQANCPPVPQTYNLFLSEVKDCGIDLIEKLPTFKNIKSTLYRYRNKSVGVSKMRYCNVEEVEVPEKFKEFLLADYLHDKNRIIVFTIKEAREVIPQCKDFFSDGTFKSCPKPFSQIYTIHGDLRSHHNFTNIVPLIYAFMTRRDAASYEILFNLIKSQIPSWDPKTYKTDFEKATMKSIKKVLPSAKLKGCYTHYKKSIWDKAREFNLIAENIQKHREVALTAVLPLLPQSQVNNGWVYIRRKTSSDANIGKFRKYVEETWLKEDFIPVWNVFGERHRTTNLVEAWHHKLNTAVGQKNPTFLHVLNVLQEDASYFVVRRLQIEKDINKANKRSKKAVLNDEFIQEAQMELLHNEINVGQFLEIMRH